MYMYLRASNSFHEKTTLGHSVHYPINQIS